jgi:iron complex transport system substrate-binding protein
VIVPGSYTPRRIACLQPSATVILDRLGELDRVVACTKYCADVVPAVRNSNRLIVADSWTSQSNELLAARPDLVIAAVPYQEKAIAEILKAGIRFLGLAPQSLADIYADITVIAGVVNARERGEAVVGSMQLEIESTRRKTTSLPRRRVFCEEWGKPIITSQSWVAELVEAAGGDFLGTSGAQQVSETILQHDPEVIIAAWCGAGDRVPLDKIIRERGWSKTIAARNAQVYCISDELLNTPAPTLIDGLHALAAAIHPQDFPPPHGLRSISEVAPAKIIHRRKLV